MTISIFDLLPQIRSFAKVNEFIPLVKLHGPHVRLRTLNLLHGFCHLAGVHQEGRPIIRTVQLIELWLIGFQSVPKFNAQHVILLRYFLKIVECFGFFQEVLRPASTWIKLLKWSFTKRNTAVCNRVVCAGVMLFLRIGRDVEVTRVEAHLFPHHVVVEGVRDINHVPAWDLRNSCGDPCTGRVAPDTDSAVNVHDRWTVLAKCTAARACIGWRKTAVLSNRSAGCPLAGLGKP
mmetsp:Transcript_128040/g.232769  ORF Transcript_128040/g.232769 Transcript_128040/m.232769 type:complete len:234 (-) Transcript_128040:29-730(-)